MKITCSNKINAVDWDTYVQSHSESGLYHLSGWQNVIEKTYAHQTYYLVARQSNKSTNPSSPENQITGILSLIQLKNFIFGNSLISIPFFDSGGILADNEEVEKDLLLEAIKLAQKLKTDTLEIRHMQPLSALYSNEFQDLDISGSQPVSHKWSFRTCLQKARMLLELSETSEALMKSFKSKLRSQIKKTMKNGFISRIGGKELIDDFYKVFLINMRDLGSPVHSKALMQNVFEEFGDRSKVLIVSKDNIPVAGSIFAGFKDTLQNPWSSSLRQYSRLAPNMLLYWTMLEYACDNGYKWFDFGRSTPGEGTYNFKKQWGAKPEPLHWYYVPINSKSLDLDALEKTSFSTAIKYWQKLPASVTKFCGPTIRKHISL